MAERPAEVPGEEGEAEDPEDEEAQVREEIVSRVQGENEMEGRCCCKGNYRQKGDCEKLWLMVSRNGRREWMALAYNDEGPWYIVFFYVQVVDEEDQNAGNDDGGEQLTQS